VKPGKLVIQESTDTTHYTIADEEGNVVAVTYTLNGGYGCGVTPPGLGFLLNNEMDDFATKPGDFSSAGISQGEANVIEPGKRPLSSMTPTIVLKEGRFFLTLGSPGGPTIIATVLQVLVNVLDFHMNVQDAADSPRIHHQWMPDRISLEREFPPATVSQLKARGHKIKKRGPIGEVAAIQKEGEWLAGGVDSRMEGAAKGY
jgi:gamma-glutamyltranspeptidase/glutathione hydrolase